MAKTHRMTEEVRRIGRVKPLGPKKVAEKRGPDVIGLTINLADGRKLKIDASGGKLKPGVQAMINRILSGQVVGRRRAVERPAESPAPAPATVDPAAFEPGVRARLLLRGREIAEADLRSSGGAYELGDVRKLLGGITRQAVAKKVDEGSLLAVEGPERARRYPVAQFGDDGRPVPGLRDVLGALPSGDPWVKLNFLIRPERRLGGKRPIEALKEGRVGEVVAVARTLHEQGAR